MIGVCVCAVSLQEVVVGGVACNVSLLDQQLQRERLYWQHRVRPTVSMTIAVCSAHSTRLMFTAGECGGKDADSDEGKNTRGHRAQ